MTIQLVSSIDSPAKNVPAQRPELTSSPITLVASGKGGVGKTWFAITLSHALALSGARTLLFDGDLGLANVDIQLGVMPDKDLSAFFEGEESLDALTFNFPKTGFDLLAGRSGCGSLADLPAPHLILLREGLKKLAARYDHVIIDLGAGLGPATDHFLSLGESCLLVVTDEPTSLTDAYAFTKVAASNTHCPDIQVVVNQADSPGAGRRTYETLSKACQKFLDFEPELAGIIRRDSHVRESICQQTPLLSRHPICAASEDVQAVARRLRG